MGAIGSKRRNSAKGQTSSDTYDKARAGTVVEAGRSGSNGSTNPSDRSASQIVRAHRSSPSDVTDENVDRSNQNLNAPAESKAAKSPRMKGDLKRDLGSWKKVRNHKTMAERKRQLRSRTPHSIRVAAHMTLRGSVHEFDRVALPEGENLNEWLAFHTLHFFEAAILMNGTLQEACTKERCPEMNAGPKYKYLWADGSRVKDPIDVPAPEYISLMFAWIDEQVNDTKIFPEDQDVKFPRTFKSVVRKIFSRLFRLYAHIYRNHMKDVTAVGAEAHLNSCFRHFIQFVKEFKLLQEKEMKPLDSVMRTLDRKIQERKEAAEKREKDLLNGSGDSEERKREESAATSDDGNLCLERAIPSISS